MVAQLTLVVAYALTSSDTGGALTPEEIKDAIEEVIDKARELGSPTVATVVWPALPAREEAILTKIPASDECVERLL